MRVHGANCHAQPGNRLLADVLSTVGCDGGVVDTISAAIPAHPQPFDGGAVSEQNKACIREFLDRVLTTGDIAAAGRYFHADMVEEVPFPGRGPGLDGLQETLTVLRAAFLDMRWRTEEQLAQDNRVLTRFVWEGTHRGSFMGIAPTDRAVSVWGMVIDQFDGPKVKSTRILMDTLGLLQQLGALRGAPGP